MSRSRDLAGGTVDGVDVSVRDAILTSTTTTADAALPKSGGAITGAITTNSTIDGRDLAADGTRLDGMEDNADVTDTANVVASLTAGANITIASDGTIAGSASGTVDLSAVAQHIIPDGNGTRDLGTDLKRFRDIFLSGSTINLGGATMSIDSTSGAIALVPKATTGTPNPTGIVIAGDGTMKPVVSSGGTVSSSAINTAAASDDATPATTVVTNVGDLPSSPSAGTLGFVTSNNNLYAYSGTNWHTASSSGSGAATLNDLTDCTVSTSDPTITTNPTSGVGHMWINKTSGEQYILIDATAGANEWYNVGDGFDAVAPLSATGGTITQDAAGSYNIHTFTSSGTFSVASTITVEYLVIAGGGGGGVSNGGGAGGGAGGYRNSTGSEDSGGSSNTAPTLSLAAGDYTVTIGAGGAGFTAGGTGNRGEQGSDSVFGSITSIGGGWGGGDNGGSLGGGGGSAGGSARGNTTATSGTVGQGSNGGHGRSNEGGGGGGAGSAGTDGLGSPNRGGNGGNGLTSSITDSAVARAGGGGGGAESPSNDLGGIGGTGGGGKGGQAGSIASVPTAGAVNTGSGGGGSGDYNTGGNHPGKAGGSGIVIIRYAV